MYLCLNEFHGFGCSSKSGTDEWTLMKSIVSGTSFNPKKDMSSLDFCVIFRAKSSYLRTLDESAVMKINTDI